MELHVRRLSLALALGVLVLVGLVAGAFTTAATGASQAPDHAAGSCRAGYKPAVIGGNFKCLHAGQFCASRYQKAYRKYGFTCVNGHLRKGVATDISRPLTPAPAPAPPVAPPPPPPAQPGHYKGLTSQNETFEFDVTADGRAFRGLKTGQINEGCTPPLHIYGNYLDWPYFTVPIAFDGGFAINVPFNGTMGGSYPSVNRLVINGQMTGTVGVGSLELKTYFTVEGVPYECGSGRQTWTVTRTG